MPLTAEQITALDALTGVDPQELADAFHEKHGKAAQLINDAGDAAATKRAGSEKRTLEKALEKEQNAHEATRKKLSDNDPAKVHEQYQAEIVGLKEAHAAEVRTLKDSGTEKERARDLAQLEAKLSTRLKPMALKATLRDPEVAKRITYEEDGTRRVLQIGKDTAYSPSRGQDPLELLAADLVEQVKAESPDDVLVNGKPGGGSGGQGSGSGAVTVEQLMEDKIASGGFQRL